MKVVGTFEYGGPEKLEVGALPDPHAGPGEIRMRVHAAAVNPADTLIRVGDIADYLGGQALPVRPGMDAAGVVDEIGPDTSTNLKPGDRVMAMVNPTEPGGGAYAEYLVLPASRVIRAPKGSSHVEAAAIPMAGLTARLALDVADVAPGGTIGVTGATGTVGGYVVSMAKADGLRVIAIASEADEAFVRSLGADEIVRRGGNVVDGFLKYAPEGVDAMIDCALLASAVVPAIRDGGHMACLRGPTERGMTPVESDRVTVSHIHVLAYQDHREKLEAVLEAAENGTLQVHIAKTFPAEQACEAHRLIEAGGVRGRLVLEF